MLWDEKGKLVRTYADVVSTGNLQVLDCKWFSYGLFVFQVPLYLSYLVELYPSYPRITLIGTVFLKLDTLLTRAWLLCFDLILILPFVDTLDELAEILEGWRYLEFYYHHTRTWQPWWHAETAPKYNYFPRVGHCHPQYQQLQLSKTSFHYQVNLVELFYSWVLKNLKLL